MELKRLRQVYHQRVCEEIIRLKGEGTGCPNFADKDNRASVHIAWGIVQQLGHAPIGPDIKGQEAGNRFQQVTRDFLESSFDLLKHIRPGQWSYSTTAKITSFDQYSHLADLERLVSENDELALLLGQGYIVKPDIIISRRSLDDNEINRNSGIVNEIDQTAIHSPLRRNNLTGPTELLHASVSCKWTIRSDRGQNTRTEALNLIRNRKGNLPHVVVVAAEPLPMRLAALALGTGDIDCVYHFALNELENAVADSGNEDQQDMLRMLIEGKRLRDISDLPLDLAI